MKTLGQLAFEAYNLSRGGVNYRGEKTPDWEDLGEGIQAAWEAAAEAVVLQLEERKDERRRRSDG